MRYHWGLAIGHLYTHSHSDVAPISTSAKIGNIQVRHEPQAVEQAVDGASGKDDHENLDTASDIQDRDQWDREDGDHWVHEGSDQNFEYDSDSDSQHSHTASETESEHLEVDAMYGDTLDVECTSFD